MLSLLGVRWPVFGRSVGNEDVLLENDGFAGCRGGDGDKVTAATTGDEVECRVAEDGDREEVD